VKSSPSRPCRSHVGLRLAGLLLLLVAFAGEARAQSPLLSVDFSKSVPLGPFRKNETVQIIGTVTNTSIDQPIVICEGICIGDEFTYSLGALASIPDGYTFRFGIRKNTKLGFLNGQIAGELLPGESKDFVFGEFLPISNLEPGTYGPFAAQIQIFAATAERPMVGSSTLSGTWQVQQ
jgi:hypothetical protein